LIKITLYKEIHVHRIKIGFLSTCLLGAPFLSHAEKQNYAEIGIGSTVYSSSYVSSIEDTDSPLSYKILTGGQLLNNPHLWYELSYNYSSKVQTKDGATEISSRAVGHGFRLITNPINKLSGFIRFGIGRANIIINTINNYQHLTYAGAGISLAQGNEKSLNFEIKHTQYEDINNVDLNNTSAFVTFSQYIY